MSQLINELKHQIVKQLNLVDIAPESIATEEPLFGEGLGLDSIDALELIVLLEKNYGVKLPSAEEGRKVFHSVQTMADFIEQNRK